MKRFQDVLIAIRLCREEYQFHRSLPLAGDVIISCDNLVINGERETSSMTAVSFKNPVI